MKNIILKYLFFFCVITFFSCENVEEFPKDVLPNQDVEVVNGKIIRFKNNDVYYAVLDRLMRSSEIERMAYLDSLQFESQFVLLKKADEELENICQSDNKQIFIQRYREFKKKIGNDFMFNNIDQEDLSPYCKLVNSENELFANNESEFLIGDSLVKCKQFDDFAGFFENQSVRTKSPTLGTDPNHAGAEKDKRKVGLYMSLSKDGTVYSRFTAQKKNLFGWVRYSTVYYAKFYLAGPLLFFECREFGYANERYVHKLDFEITTIELGGNTTVKFGTIGDGSSSLPPVALPSLTGNIEIWSRGISYEDRGIGRVNLNI